MKGKNQFVFSFFAVHHALTSEALPPTPLIPAFLAPATSNT